MLTDIRSRLLSSYLLVIGTLVIVFVGLLVVMRPLQVVLLQVQLGLELRRLAEFVQQIPPPERTPRNIPRLLGEQATTLNSRLLIVNPGRNNTVVFDSTDAWTGSRVQLNQRAQARNRTLRGTAVGPGDTPFVYVAVPFARPAANNSNPPLLALVAPQPRTVPDVMTELGWWFLIAGLIAFLISIILSFLIARSVANPLRAIAFAAEAIAQGNYNRQVAESGPDEVQQVARSFNRMLAEVQANQAAMRNFVSNASHELKTPLTSIKGFSQAIRDGDIETEADQQRYASIIYDEAERMRRLVEDLLDLARIDAGQIVIGKSPIDLAALLDLTLDSLSAQAEAKHIILQRLYQGLPHVVGNGDRLTQVFTNLVDNAIRHTPPGGKITVLGHGERQGRLQHLAPDAMPALKAKPFVRVCVADSGPGIAPEEAKHIFERLYQIDKSRKRGQGMGLGLAIAHDIIQAHGGHIQVESTASQGAEFTVWLPTTEADVTTLVARRQTNSS